MTTASQSSPRYAAYWVHHHPVMLVSLGQTLLPREPPDPAWIARLLAQTAAELLDNSHTPVTDNRILLTTLSINSY